MSKKRELSPASRDRNQPPFQQQKSISDIIGPMVAQCHLDLADNQSLASLAHNSAQATLNAVGGSTATSRQTNEESNPDVEGEEETYDATKAGELEAGFTDADGRISDSAKAAAKAVKKAGKKGARALAEDIESAVHATKDIVEGTARHCADGVEDTVDAARDAVGNFINRGVGHAGRAFNQQPSLEERPSNNVHISHPIDGAGQMVPMGMHIQPEIFKKGSGQQVLMVEPGKLADQASLKEKDVIIAIDETDVTEKSLDEVLHIFGTISSTFSMTVVRRRLHLVLVRHIITVEVHVNDDNAVAIKVVDDKCSTLDYLLTPNNCHISHGVGTSSLKYMCIIDDVLTMHHQPNDVQSVFKMNVYRTGRIGSDCEVQANHITLEHVSCNKAVAITEENNVHQPSLDNTTGLTGTSIDANLDFRFFYKHHPDAHDTYVCCFESSENSTQGKFLAVDGDDLRLEPYSPDKLNNIPSRFKFTLVPE